MELTKVKIINSINLLTAHAAELREISKNAVAMGFLAEAEVIDEEVCAITKTIRSLKKRLGKFE